MAKLPDLECCMCSNDTSEEKVETEEIEEEERPRFGRLYTAAR